MLQFEVAGTVIQLEDTEAALVVYCNETWRNVEISLETYKSGILSGMGFYETGKAVVVGRKSGESAIYAAIFPCITLDKKYADGKKTTASIKGGKEKIGWQGNTYPYYQGSIELYAGNITEIDWTDKIHAK